MSPTHTAAKIVLRTIAVVAGAAAVGGATLGFWTVLDALLRASGSSAILRVSFLALMDIAVGCAGFLALRYGFSRKPVIPAK